MWARTECGEGWLRHAPALGANVKASPAVPGHAAAAAAVGAHHRELAAGLRRRGGGKVLLVVCVDGLCQLQRLLVRLLQHGALGRLLQRACRGGGGGGEAA